MAELDYTNFLNEIRSDSLDPTYIFMGKEEYLMNDSIKRLKKEYINSFEELNFVNIKGKDAELDTLINACETLPFMSEKKIVIMKDIDKFLANLDKNEEKELYKYLDTLEDFICLIFMDNTDSIKKNTKFYKYFNKKKRAVDFSKLVGRNLNQWIENILKQYNKKMSFSNISYFIEKTSYQSRNIDLNLYDLENELLKIIDHSKEENIGRDSIDEILVKSIDTNIFELLDAISRFDSSNAIRTFNEMYMSNEPLQRILYMITRQMRLLLAYKLYKKKGYNQPQMQEKLKIGSYEFRKISSQSSKWEVKRLEEIMDKLLDVDIKIKTTSTDDKLLIEMLLVQICNNK
ncbi:MAG TPA: DNA polymerase III subunit delta [Tissierellaceae bacterium]|nr:DNA polymerase III subunit delta [Tissierellaceae bacterium]